MFINRTVQKRQITSTIHAEQTDVKHVVYSWEQQATY